MNVLSMVKCAFNLLSTALCLIFMYVVKKSTCCKSGPVIINISKNAKNISPNFKHRYFFL